MKTTTIAIVLFVMSVLGMQAQLRVNAGNDTTFCSSCIPDGTVRLGTTMKIENGTPPYTYKWTTKLNLFSNSYFYAKTFLNDTTFATPVVIDYSDSKWHPFYLEVTDANQQHARDTILVRFSQFGYTLSEQIYNARIGDVIDIAGGGFGGGILPYKKFRWSPTTGLSSPDSLVTKCKVSGTMTYTFTVTDSVGCESSVSVNVKATTPVYQPIFGKDSTYFSALYFGQYMFRIQKDTLLEGQVYKVLPFGDMVRVTSDNSKVYVRPEISSYYFNNQKEYLVMDLNMKLGDYFILNDSTTYGQGMYKYGSLDSLVVDSVYFLNGLKHIRFDRQMVYVGPDWNSVYFKLEFIEGVGTTIGLNYRPRISRTQFSNSPIICYFKDDAKFYSTVLFEEYIPNGGCYSYAVGINEKRIENSISVAVDKHSNQLILKSNNGAEQDYAFALYSANGTLLKRIDELTLPATIPLSNLTNGVYIVSLKTATSIQNRKIVVSRF